jgi:hypothetical protein
MANATALEGKEYIDFLLDFLQGKKGAQTEEEKKAAKPQTRRLPTFCKLELTQEHVDKLQKVLKESGEDLTLYMNTRNGMKVLADSLFFNDLAIQIFADTLPNY